MNTIATSELFWVILAGYVFFVLGAGLFFARNNQSTEDFFFGGRRFSWWLIGMSMLATGIWLDSNYILYAGQFHT